MGSIRTLVLAILVLSAVRPGRCLAQAPLPIDEDVVISAGEVTAAPGETAIVRTSEGPAASSRRTTSCLHRLAPSARMRSLP